MSIAQSWRAILMGAGAVVLGHALVLFVARLIEGKDPVLAYSVIAVLFLGVIQLAYVIPLVVYGLWRNRGVAVGAVSVGVLTLLFSVVGLLH